MTSNLKLYLNSSAEEINDKENRYNFIPVETSKHVALKSINKLCVKTTRQIAINKQKNLNTSKLEKNLRIYRDYSLRNKSRAWDEI